MVFGELGRLFVRFLVWSSGTWIGSPQDAPSHQAEEKAEEDQ